MPDTLTPVHPLLRGILDHPREWDRLLVYADWLEEQGGRPCGRCGGTGHHWVIGPTNVCPDCDGTGRADPAVEALGWRLLAGQRRWPFCWDRAGRFTVTWRCCENPARETDNNLSPQVWRRLRNQQKRQALYHGDYGDYDDVPVALADAARAYGLAYLAGRQPEEARRG